MAYRQNPNQVQEFYSQDQQTQQQQQQRQQYSQQQRISRTEHTVSRQVTQQRGQLMEISQFHHSFFGLNTYFFIVKNVKGVSLYIDYGLL